MSIANAPDQPITRELAARPWWKEFYVWMVIAGPVSVVIACAVKLSTSCKALMLWCRKTITVRGSRSVGR